MFLGLLVEFSFKKHVLLRAHRMFTGLLLINVEKDNLLFANDHILRQLCEIAAIK